MTRSLDRGVLCMGVLGSAGRLALACSALLAAGSVASGEAAKNSDLLTLTTDARALNTAIEDLDPLTRRYMEHAVVLASEFMEGREPGTRGNEVALDYLEWHFDRMGMKPAFVGSEVAMDGTEVVTSNASWLQRFEVGGETRAVSQAATWSVGRSRFELEAGESFNVLGISGTGAAEGELVFVGYGIEDGPDGYSSFDAGTDLTGKIAVMFRFEPMDAAGQSKWGQRGRWSNYASMSPKMEAVASRGAAGIILLQPPGADDPRARRLESVSTTNFGFEMDVPVVMLDTKTANELVTRASRDGSSLLDLRRAADDGEVRTVALDRDGARFSMDVELETIRTPTDNFGALLPGRGELADEFVIVGGHMDHLGYGDFGSRYRGDERLMHLGADDNASGTAAVMVVAELLGRRYSALPEGEDARSVLFLLFNAEEMGLLGARYFVESSGITASDVTAMLNLDMIGRLGENNLEIFGVGTAEEWDGLLDPVIESMGFETDRRPGGMGPSDHAWFFRSDMPVLHFFSGLHDDYHHPRDVWTTLDFAEATRLSVGVTQLVMDLATRGEQLTFVANTDNSRPTSRPQLARMTVRMGVMPGNYEEGVPGLEIGGVTPGGSADEAGLRAGDKIVLWNGEELAGVNGLMTRLGEAKPGDVVNLLVERDGERVELKMTLQAREETGG